jgi:hypothetical protein
VFEYHDAAGKVVREYRPPEEVAKADSLATIDDLPVTIMHPPMGTVNGETFSRISVGHVRSPKVDGEVVRGVIVVGRKDAREGVQAGKYAETSMGYTCRQDMTPGVTPDGQTYDAVQRDIEYNHVAILPPGQARLGTRLDSAEAPVLRLDSAGHQVAPGQSESEPNTMIKIKRDGKDVELVAGSPEHIAHLEAERDTAAARADANDAELAKFREDAAKAERAALETRAATVLGKDAKHDGKSDRQVKEAVIAKRLPAIKCDGKDDAYVDGVFEAALAAPSPVAKPKAGSQAVVNALATAGRGDAADPDAASEDEEAFAKKAAEDKKKADSAWERG